MIFILSKGRNLIKTLIYLRYYNIYVCENLFTSRKLFYKTNLKHLYILIIKNSDINFYINNNFVDLAFFGKDLFYDLKLNIFYKIFNLFFIKFNLCLISNKIKINFLNKLKIFTKYSIFSKYFFNYLNINIDLLNINSSLELMLLLNNKNLIIDIISSKKTINVNNLYKNFTLIELNNVLLLNLKLLYDKIFLFFLKKIIFFFNVIF